MLEQFDKSEPGFLELNNRYARIRTPGFHVAGSVLGAMQRYAADHPHKFGDVAERLAGGDLSTILSLGGPRRMCEVLAGMAGEKTRKKTVKRPADVTTRCTPEEKAAAERAVSLSLKQLIQEANGDLRRVTRNRGRARAIQLAGTTRGISQAMSDSKDWDRFFRLIKPKARRQREDSRQGGSVGSVIEQTLSGQGVKTELTELIYQQRADDRSDRVQ